MNKAGCPVMVPLKRNGFSAAEHFLKTFFVQEINHVYLFTETAVSVYGPIVKNKYTRLELCSLYTPPTKSAYLSPRS